MATLDDRRTRALRVALHACDVRMRNWSGGETNVWTLAIYTLDDTYIGCVRLTGETLALAPTKFPPARTQRVQLEKLCATYIRHLQDPT